MGTLTIKYRVIGFSKSEVITNSYGPKLNQEKDNLLDILSYINTLWGKELKRWLLGGYFNNILTLEEKSGGLKCLDQDNNMFLHLIDNLNLIDIDTKNGSFTWSNKWAGIQNITSRMDHFLL